jgi:hypothetical protein
VDARHQQLHRRAGQRDGRAERYGCVAHQRADQLQRGTSPLPHWQHERPGTKQPPPFAPPRTGPGGGETAIRFDGPIYIQTERGDEPRTVYEKFKRGVKEAASGGDPLARDLLAVT